MIVLRQFTRYMIQLTASVSSLLLGASIVHNIYKPDVTIPKLSNLPEKSDDIFADKVMRMISNSK